MLCVMKLSAVHGVVDVLGKRWLLCLFLFRNEVGKNELKGIEKIRRFFCLLYPRVSVCFLRFVFQPLI